MRLSRIGGSMGLSEERRGGPGRRSLRLKGGIQHANAQERGSRFAEGLTDFPGSIQNGDPMDKSGAVNRIVGVAGTTRAAQGEQGLADHRVLGSQTTAGGSHRAAVATAGAGADHLHIHALIDPETLSELGDPCAPRQFLLRNLQQPWKSLLLRIATGCL
jgi:hypothetical protein